MLRKTRKRLCILQVGYTQIHSSMTIMPTGGQTSGSHVTCDRAQVWERKSVLVRASLMRLMVLLIDLGPGR